MMTEFTLRVSDIENLTELYYIIQKDTQIYVPDLEKPYIESHISFPDQNPPAPKNVLILDSEQLKTLDADTDYVLFVYILKEELV